MLLGSKKKCFSFPLTRHRRCRVVYDFSYDFFSRGKTRFLANKNRMKTRARHDNADAYLLQKSFNRIFYDHTKRSTQQTFDSTCCMRIQRWKQQPRSVLSLEQTTEEVIGRLSVLSIITNNTPMSLRSSSRSKETLDAKTLEDEIGPKCSDF